MSAHSPGPWLRCGKVAQLRDEITDSGESRLVCSVFVREYGEDGPGVASWPEGEANARLIVAAPDLLALAHRYASECGDCAGTRVKPDDQPCEDCAFIWAVINKAERPEDDDPNYDEDGDYFPEEDAP